MKLELEGLTDRQYEEINKMIDRFKVENGFPETLSEIKRTILKNLDCFYASPEQAKLLLQTLPLPTDWAMANARVNISNPAIESQHMKYTMRIQYYRQDGRETWIQIPIEGAFKDILLKEHIIVEGTRPVYPCERNWFVGMSDAKFSKLTKKCYKFNIGNVAYYGGDMSCEGESVIKAIVNLITLLF